MRWRTYTPDGRTLEIDHTDGTWVASCDGVLRTGASPAEAMHAALSEEPRAIGSSRSALAAWIQEQASTLEREAEPDS